MLRRSFNILLVFTLLIGALLISSKLVLADQTSSLTPSSAGFYSGWTPSTGSNNVGMVDEASCNGNADYNYTTVRGSRDSYAVSLSSVPNGSIIKEIRIIPCASKHKKGGINTELDVFYRLDGVNSGDSGNYMLSGTNPVSLSATTFSGLSVTKTSSTTLEVGGVYSAGNKGVALSKIEVIVVYTTPPIPTPTPTPTPTTAILAPSNVTITTEGCDVLGETSLVAWRDNSDNEDGFELQRSDVSDSGPFYPLASVSANISFYHDTATPSGCFYRIRGFNSTAVSDWSYTEVIQ